MTSRESFNSNGLEADGTSIRIEIGDQSVFPTKVYAIPKNKMGVTTLIKLPMRIANQSATYLRFNQHQPFIPELLASNGQTIPRLLVTDESVAIPQPNRPQEHSGTREFQRWEIPLISPGQGTFIPQTARLSWQDNLLQLKIPTSRVCPNDFWLFTGLQSRSYQLRFISNINCEITPEESENQELVTGSELIATPFLNLHLVMPRANDSSVIEVDGVQFQIEMPKTVLAIPPNRRDTETQVTLGIRVTNNTSTTQRFEQLGSLDLNLIDVNGKEIPVMSGMTRLWVGKGPKYYLAQPGESVLFVLNGTFDWHFNQLVLAIPNKAGGNYLFPGLQPGTYQLQLIYHVLKQRADYFKEKILEQVWFGWIAMPLAEFCLVEP